MSETKREAKQNVGVETEVNVSGKKEKDRTSRNDQLPSLWRIE
jgi:hypothetical protein